MKITICYSLSLVCAIAVQGHLKAQVPAPVSPVNARIMHPGIANAAVGAIYNGSSPMLQYNEASPEWNNGEGFDGGAGIDYGGWFNNDDGSLLTINDVHVWSGWQSATWTEPFVQQQGSIDHLVGYLRPYGNSLRVNHPAYGSVGNYVDQAAFELFRPSAAFDPATHSKIVVIIYNWETVTFPMNAQGKAYKWYQVYQGFFSPDGLSRDEAVGGAAGFLANNSYDSETVRRPGGYSQLLRDYDPSSTWYPVIGYVVPSVTNRQADLNEQRNMQLRKAIIELLKDGSANNPIGSANKLENAAEVKQKVVVVFSGGSNGGLQSKWSLLRYPDLVHGAFCSVINPSMQRMYGEHDLGYAVGMLSGSPDPGAGILLGDFMHWGRYAWSQGYWMHDISYTRCFELGETCRPACFMCGDEDITTTGTDWAGLAAGGAHAPFGVRFKASAGAPWPLGSELGWTIAETACHGNVAEVHNPYQGGAPTFYLGELTKAVVEQAIAQRGVELNTSPAPVVSRPTTRVRTSELMGLDDPHEWALGRAGEAMPDHSNDPLLRRDDDWFDAMQPGAAGTYLGQLEAMRIHDGKVLVVGAEGVVSSFEVDTAAGQKGKLQKTAHSNDGTTNANGVVIPQSLGHDGTGMVVSTNGSVTELIVGTRRHLHRLNINTLEILQSVQLPWEISRPHHLQLGDVLPQLPRQLIFASKHGGLVFCDLSLNTIFEWPEPGIVDFVIRGGKVTILSSRGVVADVTFELNPAGPLPYAPKLQVVSRPIPRQLTAYPAPMDPPCQGDPHDLELFKANWTAQGAGVVTSPIALWTGDKDGTAVRGYFPPDGAGSAFVSNASAPFAGIGGLDIATCTEGASHGPADVVGDNLLLLQNDNLSLYNQYGVLIGQKALWLAGAFKFNPFGYQAHSMVVGDLVSATGSGAFTEEVVIATQSGALMWMHINELVGLPAAPLGAAFVPDTANGGASGTAIQPRTNQSLSATWAIAERNDGSGQLHLIDQRGGYWRIPPSGPLCLWEADPLVARMRGMDDLGNLDANGDPIAVSAGLFSLDDFTVGTQSLGGAVSLRSEPWSPLDVHHLPLLNNAINWSRFSAGSTAFEGFMTHRWGGDLLDVVPGGARECYFWSARAPNVSVGSLQSSGSWGNLVEGIRFPSAAGPWDVVGLWASSEDSSATTPQAGLDYHALRSFVSIVPIMTHQSVSAVQLPDDSPKLVLGCPGGRVRVVDPVVGDHQQDHLIGTLQSQLGDYGFGGSALATKVVGPSTVRIWFGTLYGGTPLPTQYGQQQGALAFTEVATGGVHVVDWSPSLGFSPVNSRSLAPSASDRGGYGVVGICVSDLLPETGPAEDEVVVTTLAGDIFVLDAGTLVTKWRTHIPGAAGFYNSIKVTDLNNDFKMELYVAGSLGVWRFEQP